MEAYYPCFFFNKSVFISSSQVLEDDSIVKLGSILFINVNNVPFKSAAVRGEISKCSGACKGSSKNTYHPNIFIDLQVLCAFYNKGMPNLRSEKKKSEMLEFIQKHGIKSYDSFKYILEKSKDKGLHRWIIHQKRDECLSID